LANWLVYHCYNSLRMISHCRKV